MLKEAKTQRMTGRKDYAGQILGWWVSAVQRHALPVLMIALLFTAGVLYYSIRHFRINVDTSGMISDTLRFRRLEDDFLKAFPQLRGTIVVVLDADAPELALSARTRMAERLRKEPRLFRSVYEPGGGAFFEENGLLYLSQKELEAFADDMAGAQPFLAMLSQDLSVRGLLSVLEKALVNTDAREAMDKRIALLFDAMADTFEQARENRSYPLPWQRIMLGDSQSHMMRHQFIILQPVLDGAKLSSGEVALDTLRRIAGEMGFTGGSGVKMHLTGEVVLARENLIEVRNSVGAATFVSFLLVAVTLFVGLGRSGRLVLSSLATLTAGLIWTTGFAVVFIGPLNLISVTFAVLFVGLGIDYSIQFCLRYREVIETGCSNNEGLVITAKGVGRSLLVSCITIAIGFYAFVPTAYAGVGELGLISGTGMFISFFANLTILPALLTLFPVKRRAQPPLMPGKGLVTIPYRHSLLVGIGGLVLGAGAALLLPRLYFDYNPLNLHDRKSEAITTIKELFRDPEAAPWTASVLAKNGEEAQETAGRLRKLKEVKRAITLFDFVPEDQPEKLRIISDVALLMPPSLKDIAVHHLDDEQKIRACNSFEKELEKSLRVSPAASDQSARRLYASIQHFTPLANDPAKGGRACAALEEGLLSILPSLLRSLETSLKAEAFGMADLPGELVAQYLTRDGRYRVQIFPKEDITDREALRRFVDAVRTVAPDATDTPVSVFESGRAVVSSFRQATLSALVVIALYLLIELRSLAWTVLVLIPMVLAMVLTGSFSVLFNVPLNFANVIIAPLLLGVGVHNGIIFILRHRTEPPSDGNVLRTSTARALLFSTLTMIVSTGSLAFSSHRGIASMGMLLAVCLGFLMLCTLILLPALLELTGRRAKREE